MLPVENHSSVVIIESEDSGQFIFSKYDPTYRIPQFRGNINLLGGRSDTKDAGPKETLIREVNEELCKPQEDKGFAQKRDIKQLREEIIHNAEPYFDFLIICSIEREKKVDVISCYTSKISRAIFSNTSNQLRDGKRFVSEGLIEIVNTGDLVSGRYMPAWITSSIMSLYLEINLPNPHGLVGRVIGSPKNYFSEYSQYFS